LGGCGEEIRVGCGEESVAGCVVLQFASKV
jgi:hypothetical protein